MKYSLLTLAALMATSFSQTALADDISCPNAATQSPISIEAAIGKAETLGYAVSEAKRSKGCWKIEGYDRNGAEIEIVLDPQSGEVVKPNRWRPPAGASR